MAKNSEDRTQEKKEIDDCTEPDKRIQRTPDELFLFSFPQLMFSNRNFKKPILLDVTNI